MTERSHPNLHRNRSRKSDRQLAKIRECLAVEFGKMECLDRPVAQPDSQADAVMRFVDLVLRRRHAVSTTPPQT